MSRGVPFAVWLLSLASMVAGCAALPFLPLIAEVPKMITPDGPQSGAKPSAEATPMKPDPVIQAAISTPPVGDAGVMIPQTDRVAFQPDAQGSIPLRVAAADLVSDVKARSVGDVVTVNVVEAISSEAKAGTTVGNQRAITGALPNFFGVAESLGKHNKSVNLNSLLNSSSSNSTTGTGDMTADDTFTATVSTIVVGVNPTGTLAVKGDRQMRVNGENDTIHLSGIVRPQDLDSNNQISSTQVADLELSLTGEGQIRDKQGNGIGTRIFDWLWLF
jgi:flagellar L-ring protein precursor FlgH